ncbi:hypothetical protein ACOY6G_24830, partial [Enterobacter hormaechei]|uniref:hypothetical protein n=1 Tax=Enterobacter hormaechei TaxID=158836 RepID=UPI003BE48BF4
MMSLWDALRMNMMISYQELVRTFPKAYPTYVSVHFVGRVRRSRHPAFFVALPHSLYWVVSLALN